MKKSYINALICACLYCCILLTFSSCSKNQATRTYTIYTPVYEDKATALSAINGNSNQSFSTAGKIYIKDNYIFVNDIDKGIHIIDNTNPSHPLQVAYLNIPGNEDIAVKGNILYADMYSDLLAIDISNPKNVHLTGMVPGFFENRMFVNGSYIDSGHVIVDWITKDTTVYINQNPGGIIPVDCRACMFETAYSATSVPSATGQAGSMAKMVLLNDYLYAIIESHSLGIIDVTNASNPKAEGAMQAGLDLETIYPFENKLFLGSSIGMYMYDVTNPSVPTEIGNFAHGRACDPVVTDGSYAYITLHAGTSCGGDNNELDVVDVQDLQHAELVRTYPMTKPTGLCKDGNILFVCDNSVVKIYDASNPAALQLLNQVSCNEPYDVIAANHIALIVNGDGIYEYDYSNIKSIRQISFYSVKN